MDAAATGVKGRIIHTVVGNWLAVTAEWLTIQERLVRRLCGMK